MKALTLITFFGLFSISLTGQDSQLYCSGQWDVIEGFISQDSQKVFLRRNESGNFIEVKFMYDDLKPYNVEGLQYVEYVGRHDKEKKLFEVHEVIENDSLTYDEDSEEY